jgi:serine-type D-Ala-D-Ala carboxypeptidase/endopeptidase (penicillin-binding protein 4)
VHVKSDDCQRGFRVERKFLKRAGVNVREVALSDGRGGNPYDRVTPRATVQLLRWWMRRPDFRTFQHSLPILGVDGDLALSGRNSPARGKVFAKTGAAAGPDALNDRLVMAGKTMAGYLAGEHGRPRPFALFMNNGFFPNDPAEIFSASADLSRIAALMQQDEPRRSR